MAPPPRVVEIPRRLAPLRSLAPLLSLVSRRRLCEGACERLSAHLEGSL